MLLSKHCEFLFCVNVLKDLLSYAIVNIKKAPTPKVDASLLTACSNEHRQSCGQTGLAFFYLSFLRRKVSNAISKLADDSINAKTPRKIVMISKSVICVTSFLCTSALPKSYGQRQPPVMGTFRTHILPRYIFSCHQIRST